jgi:hypothetical protein
MTATPLSSNRLTRLKIVRSRPHTVRCSTPYCLHLEGFCGVGDSARSRFGCLIHGRRGHNLDAAL